jgi:hypothetical protein
MIDYTTNKYNAILFADIFADVRNCLVDNRCKCTKNPLLLDRFWMQVFSRHEILYFVSKQ